ncbi:MAG: DUF1080 domain-containing protein [Gemmatimonadaceae bacterium]|nr:DUF1080 domain-containing protein [Gemmatimonadaceae bacterium]
MIRPILLAAVALLAACGGAARGGATGAGAAAATHNVLSEAERRAGWRLLFDGRTLDGWRGYNATGPGAGWAVEDGAIALVNPRGANDLITTERFGDFELVLQWRIRPDGPPANSGIFYRAEEKDGENIYQSAPEMQVLDDARHPDGRSRLTSAGSLYGLYAAPAGLVRPAGQWNDVRIVVRGTRVEHWLNGTQVVNAELWSADWNARHAASKFPQWPRYARATVGHLGLQEHGSWVAFRDIKLRVLR